MNQKKFQSNITKVLKEIRPDPASSNAAQRYILDQSPEYIKARAKEELLNAKTDEQLVAALKLSILALAKGKLDGTNVDTAKAVGA